MIVYLIRNTANGRCYVGKTSGTLTRRWKQHRCEARIGRHDLPLYRDMRLYQLHCFVTEILAETHDSRRLAQLERKFIRIFDSVEKGYNVAAVSYGGRPRAKRGPSGRRMTAENLLKIKQGTRHYHETRKQAAV